MKIIVNTKALKSAANQAKAATAGRMSLPVLSCFLLEVDGARLSITGNDLDSAVTIRVECKVVSGGFAVVSASAFAGFASAADSEEITIERHGDTLTLTTPTRSAKLNCIPDEFPKPPSGDLKASFGLSSASTFFDWLKTALRFVSTEAHEYVFSGILFKSYNKEVFIASSNRHTICEINTGIGVLEDIDFIIPSKCIKTLLSLDSESDLDFLVSPNFIEIRSGSWVFLGAIAKGRFPDYRLAIPPEKAQKDSVTADRAAVIAAVDCACLLAPTASDYKKIDVSASAGRLNVSRQSNSGQRFESTVDCEGQCNWSADPVYLSNALKSMTEDRVTIRGGDASGVFISLKSPDRIVVLAPVRIK